jgi:hypothetical protein
MPYELLEGQLRRWNEGTKKWFNDKGRDTFLVMCYNEFTGVVRVYEPGFPGTSQYTPEYISDHSHEVNNGEGQNPA